MKEWIKRLFCRHSGGMTFVRNIYGDEIIQTGYKRSEWRCKKCRASILDDFPNPPGGTL